ncbi:MAG: SH3 domain-containing protein [Planctomycetes bacterium]|nr:SH3 domain-containing protein [Planctomycetota bacterium]
MKRLSGLVVVILLCTVVPCILAQDIDKTPEKAKSDMYVGKVTTAHLNLRSGPGESFRIFKVLETNNEVTVIETAGKWCRVLAPDDIAVYISKKYVKDGVITGDNVQIRPTADTKFPACGTLSKGEKVDVIDGNDPDWVKIKAPTVNTECWISAKYIMYSKAFEGEVAVNIKKKKEQIEKEKTSKQKYDEALKIIDQEDQKVSTERDYKPAISALEEVAKNTSDGELKDNAVAKLEGVKKLQLMLDELKSIKDSMPDIIEIRPADNGLPKLDPPRFDATGYVEDVGLLLDRPAEYTLTKGKEFLFYLKTKDANINLGNYLFKFVGLKGEMVYDKQWKANVFYVREIKVINKD